MQFIVYILVYPIIWCLSKLPFPLLYAFSDACYVLVYRVLGYRKKVVRYNLQTAFPEKALKEIKTIEKQFYHHLCDMFLEMIKSLSISEKELNARYQFTNPEVLVQFENQNRSVALMMGHFASYEWIFSLQSYLKYPGHALYKVIANKYFDKLVRKIRGKWNSKLIPSKYAMKIMKEQQEEGLVTVYGFAADQSPKAYKATFWTEFLGYELPFQTGAERIASQFDLPVVFFGTTKVKRGYYKGSFKIITDAPREMEEGTITGAFAKALEQQILAEPQYYLWTHKRFKHLGQKEALQEKYQLNSKTQTTV